MSSKSKVQNLETHLARVKGLGSAHHGAHHWLQERVTSVALIPLMIWFVYNVISLRGAGYEQFIYWLAQPVNAVLMIVLIIVGLWHGVMGSQVIVEDYIHNKSFKMFKLVGMKLFYGALGVACIFSILKVAFTAF